MTNTLIGPVMISTPDRLTVTMPNGDTDSREVRMEYKAAIVGYDAQGKFMILSSHYSKADAKKALARYELGRFVNTRYKLLAPGTAPITVYP